MKLTDELREYQISLAREGYMQSQTPREARRFERRMRELTKRRERSK